MSYLELKKRVIANSPSSSVKQLIRDNELLTMTKEQIANDVLYDYSGLADKCSESIDILTNEEVTSCATIRSRRNTGIRPDNYSFYGQYDLRCQYDNKFNIDFHIDIGQYQHECEYE